MINQFNTPKSAALAPALRHHRGFARVFQPGKLTLGFLGAIEGYPDGPAPTLANHGAIARHADNAGFAALWLRDVPFYDPGFGDAGQVLDPMVYAGWLAGVTKNIAIGTAGIVSPLRDPLIVAKQATTIDQLLGGRFVLGLAGGDRPEEYPAFGIPYEDRVERFQEALALIRAVVDEDFPHHTSRHYAPLEGRLDLIPKPAAPTMPAIAIGRAGQTPEWIAANMDGWIWHGRDARGMTAIVPRWRDACGDGPFKPYGYGTWFDLAEDPDMPVEPGQVLRSGRKALIQLLAEQEVAGVSHIALNLKPTRRPAEAVLDELAEHVLPHFPAAVEEASS